MLPVSAVDRQVSLTLEANGLKQHVNKSTYNRGYHIIDLVITYSWSCLILESPKASDTAMCINERNFVNDHFTVHCPLNMIHPAKSKKEIYVSCTS